MILFSAEMSREEPYMHIIQWKKPIWNGYILCDSKSVTFWKRHNYGDSEKISVDQGLEREWWTGRDQKTPQFSSVQFSSVQSLSHVRLFATPWIAGRQASLSITNSWSSLTLMSIESVCHPAISSSVVPFSSCPQSLPASGYFPMSQLFAWGGQSIGVWALIILMNNKDWSLKGWTGWISLQSKGLSRIFSNTTVQKHQFFGHASRLGLFLVGCGKSLKGFM